MALFSNPISDAMKTGKVALYAVIAVVLAGLVVAYTWRVEAGATASSDLRHAEQLLEEFDEEAEIKAEINEVRDHLSNEFHHRMTEVQNQVYDQAALIESLRGDCIDEPINWSGPPEEDEAQEELVE